MGTKAIGGPKRVFVTQSLFGFVSFVLVPLLLLHTWKDYARYSLNPLVSENTVMGAYICWYGALLIRFCYEARFPYDDDANDTKQEKAKEIDDGKEDTFEKERQRLLRLEFMDRMRLSLLHLEISKMEAEMEYEVVRRDWKLARRRRKARLADAPNKESH